MRICDLVIWQPQNDSCIADKTNSILYANNRSKDQGFGV